MPRIESTNNNPNTYRVLFDEAYFWPAPKLPVNQKSTKCQKQLSTTGREKCKGKQVGEMLCCFSTDIFHLQSKLLYGNAATLNVPVPMVFTRDASGEVIDESQWFNFQPVQENPVKPKTTSIGFGETSVRSTFQTDFCRRPTENCLQVSARAKTESPAKGIVPVTQNWTEPDKLRVWEEQISFEHAYDSRMRDNYPARGKRQGAFTWTRARPELEQQVLEKITNVQGKAELTSPNEVPEGSSMQGWCDGQSILSEKVAYHRQYAPCKWPWKVRLAHRDSVAKLLQPDLKSTAKQPIFTK
ncbi:hypothetical protein PHET_11197 [Paragonimus heterotremus]|uniref:Uncharacterized protein n=1 Tax=Paragonimus heterotremus TaxID=100268 RepID=A0A8J4SL41_9TREM|nr:hypothetical protein PHET_11197 [Paragonimus heterotremus]